jgi:hypothetical protein
MSIPQNPEHDPVELITDVDGVPSLTICQVIQVLSHGNIIATAKVDGKEKTLALAPNQYTSGATYRHTLGHELLQPA